MGNIEWCRRDKNIKYSQGGKWPHWGTSVNTKTGAGIKLWILTHCILPVR